MGRGPLFEMRATDLRPENLFRLQGRVVPYRVQGVYFDIFDIWSR